MENLSPLLCAAGDRFMQHPPCVQRVSCSSQEALPCFSGDFSFRLCRRAAGLTATVGLFVPFFFHLRYNLGSCMVAWLCASGGLLQCFGFFFCFSSAALDRDASNVLLNKSPSSVT